VRLAAAAGAAVVTLGLVEAAAAHITATPSFVTAGQRETVTFVAPNEREEAMTGLSVAVPTGLSIVEAVQPGDGWRGDVDGSTATWTGGTLASGAVTSFSLVLEASGEPGSTTLETVQLYPSGARVPWAVVLTILPGAGSSGSLGIALVVGAIGLLLMATLVLVLWLRRSRPLQEG
jgi:hypothetical protein